LQQAGNEERLVARDRAGFVFEADVVRVDVGQLRAVLLEPAALAGLAEQGEQLAAAGVFGPVQVKELDQRGPLRALLRGLQAIERGAVDAGSFGYLLLRQRCAGCGWTRSAPRTRPRPSG